MTRSGLMRIWRLTRTRLVVLVSWILKPPFRRTKMRTRLESARPGLDTRQDERREANQLGLLQRHSERGGQRVEATACRFAYRVVMPEVRPDAPERQGRRAPRYDIPLRRG